MDSSLKEIRNLVLDAGPLITQSASSLQQFAQEYYTTPGVHSELKDEYSRQQLILWGDSLRIRHPKPEYIRKVEAFAKLTGDYAVLSANDIHIIALAYELEVEANNGDWRLRKYPGEKLEHHKKKNEAKETEEQKTPEIEESPKTEVTKKKRTRRGGKKQREKREAELQKELDDAPEDTEETHEPDAAQKETELDAQESSQFVKVEPTVDTLTQDAKNLEIKESLAEDYEDDEDDGDWITPENLHEEMLKDDNEQVEENKKGGPVVKVALTTGDFACQNVAMQIGLNLMNSMSGKQIRRIRNYMYRCHACFRLTPMSKSGKPKHFCPKCGGDTLLRCAVSVDNVTGKVTPHLKANFQWIKRGTRYSLPSPLSKNQIRLAGNGGYQHNKQNRHKSLQNPLILREDQKEYDKAVKDDDWQRRQNDKLLQQWIGGGSADNYISPFNTVQNMRPSGVKVGRSRYANSSRGKGK